MQIGNAVACKFAYHLGIHINNILGGNMRDMRVYNSDVLINNMKSFENPSSHKQNIIDRFMLNVKGKQIEIKGNKHDGSEGHWLETQMGIIHNSKNESDIFGYEMKKYSSKITFGDFSASEYLFSKKKETIKNINNWSGDTNNITKNEYIRYFGTPNPLKNNRYSWSGKCTPVYGEWNYCGQMLEFNNNSDLCVYYSFSKDTREIKQTYPAFIQNDIIIAIWNRNKLEKHINSKFNNNGFFMCKKVGNVYEKICFGRSFDFDCFVNGIKNKNIIFDSGMYEGNRRNYSQFRSSAKNFWNSLVEEEF